MQRLIGTLFSMVILSIFTPSYSSASTLEDLPSIQSSKQWEVAVGKADSNNPEQNKPKPGVCNVYSLDVKNIGDENVSLVRIEAFRDEPNSTTAYELFSASNLLSTYFHHHNFFISNKATELKITITWTKNENKQRKFQEQFVFEP